jgi:hypothetical protein
MRGRPGQHASSGFPRHATPATPLRVNHLDGFLEAFRLASAPASSHEINLTKI